MFSNQQYTVLFRVSRTRCWRSLNDVFLLPKEFDEKVAKLRVPALGAKLTVLSQEQADYIGVKVKPLSRERTTVNEL